jgi:hypothetical protein
MNLLAALNSTPPPQSSPSLSLYHGVFKVTKPLDFDTHHIPDIEELWGGFIRAPTPAGVPVAIRSPGSKVNAVERYAICWAIECTDDAQTRYQELEQRLEGALEQFYQALVRRPRYLQPGQLEQQLLGARWSI